MNRCFRSTLVAGTGAAMLFPAQADPQISATAGLTPATPVAGEMAVFEFNFSNAAEPESSAMTSSQLQVQWSPLPVNGIDTYLPLISMNAPGGSATFMFDGGGNLTGVTVAYGALATGASRSFSASFQLPDSGLVNGSLFQASATLTWPEAPGTLGSSANATIQAFPSLHVSLLPLPIFTSPGGRITFQAQAMNLGSGITRRAWLVAPVSAGTRLLRVPAGAGNSVVWFSTTPYSLSEVTTHEFIMSHFQAGILDESGTPGDLSDDLWIFPPGTRTMALLLDDPALNLMPSGAPPLALTWQVEDQDSPEGTAIHQVLGYFSDEIPARTSYPQSTTIRALPAELRLTKSEDGVRVTFFGDPEAIYRVGRSGGLDDWSDLGPAAPSQGPPGIFEFHDPDPLPLRGFYRVSEE